MATCSCVASNVPRHAALVLLCLAACGGSPRDAGEPARPIERAGSGSAATTAEPDPVLGCVRGTDDEAAACVAKGSDCRIGAPTWCSGLGVPQPKDWHLQACQCLCGVQIARCQ